MVTILISGSGTGVGKTRVTAALAALTQRRGCTVQIIKPVQTGVAPGEPTDADIAAKMAGLQQSSAHTLRRFKAALAPLAAAGKERVKLEMKKLAKEILGLPKVNFRFVEGAGGVAVPLAAKGWDWADFARTIQADAIVLVVPDELGAINQSRLVYHFTQRKCAKKLAVGIFLNALSTPPRNVAQSTREALAASLVPLWGELAPHASKPKLRDSILARWLKA
jgi:dethiobiotin synthase